MVVKLIDLQFLVAFFAYPFYDIVFRLHREAVGQRDMWNRCIVETKQSVASLTIEVHVHIIIVIFVMAVAELIPDATIAVFDGVYKMMLPKQSKRAEDATLVHTDEITLQLC